MTSSEATSNDRETMMAPPRVWIAADFTATDGNWCDATATPEDLAEGIGDGQILDTDGFGDFVVQPDEEAAIVARIAAGITEHGLAFAFWAQLFDADETMCALFPQAYLGEYASAADWVRQAVLVGSHRPLDTTWEPQLADYFGFDAEAYAHDACERHDVFIAAAPEGRCWVFRGANSPDEAIGTGTATTTVTGPGTGETPNPNTPGGTRHDG